MAGAWTMTEDGEFVLNEPYASKLEEGKSIATMAWTKAMMEWLADNSQYEVESLLMEFVRRSNEQDMPPMNLVESFVIEALEGNLNPAG